MGVTREAISLHISRVYNLVKEFTSTLNSRAAVHDMSKLSSPEIEMLEKLPTQYKFEYGSKEYEEMLKTIEPLLKTHHKVNTHHPEHYPNGIDDMDLYDICEMFFDWKASSEKNNNGNIWKSLEVGKEKFGMSEQLYNILKNTADRTWKNDEI